MTLAEIVAAKTPATWLKMLTRWPALTRLTVDADLARLMRERPGVKGGGGDGACGRHGRVRVSGTEEVP